MMIFEVYLHDQSPFSMGWNLALVPCMTIRSNRIFVVSVGGFVVSSPLYVLGFDGLCCLLSWANRSYSTGSGSGQN